VKTMENHQIIVDDLTVRFRDVDAMGHVNNAVFLTYFEEGRSAFLARVLEIVDPSEYPFILARISCDYITPLKLGDRIAIQVWIGRVGKKSFVFKYRIVKRGDPDTIYAAGESTMVLFDYKENRTVPISPAFLERVQAYCEEL